jgi:hypothetical protein
MGTIAARAVRTDYTQSPVGLTDWVVIFPSLPLTASFVSIFDSSGRTLEMGICAANADANSEVRQLLIAPGGIATKIQIPTGQRVSIRAVTAPATSGENDFNVIF